VEQRLDRLEQSLSLVKEQKARTESQVEEIAGQLGLTQTLTPSRPQAYSPQFGRMVELDADGREIPPE
jgi:hypothetical protein